VAVQNAERHNALVHPEQRAEAVDVSRTARADGGGLHSLAAGEDGAMRLRVARKVIWTSAGSRARRGTWLRAWKRQAPQFVRAWARMLLRAEVALRGDIFRRHHWPEGVFTHRPIEGYIVPKGDEDRERGLSSPGV